VIPEEWEVVEDLTPGPLFNSKIRKAKFTFLVDDLRFSLNIPESYRYDNIKQLLNKCAKDMQQHSDISFTPITKEDEKKTGRRVTEVIFNVFTLEKKDSNPS
jgi:plasmid replication initiation protein